MKTTIVKVEVVKWLNTAYVTYSSGNEKLYPANKLPQTVKKWLEDHPEEPEEPEEEEPEEPENNAVCAMATRTECNTKANMEPEKKKAPQGSTPAYYRIMHPEPGTTTTIKIKTWSVKKPPVKIKVNISDKKPEEPRKEPEEVPLRGNARDSPEASADTTTLSILPAQSPGAAESVMFGLFIGMAILYEIIRGLAEILLIMAYNAGFWVWTHKEEIKEAIGNRIITPAADYIMDVLFPFTIHAGRWTAATVKAGGTATLKTMAIMAFMLSIWQGGSTMQKDINKAFKAYLDDSIINNPEVEAVKPNTIEAYEKMIEHMELYIAALSEQAWKEGYAAALAGMED